MVALLTACCLPKFNSPATPPPSSELAAPEATFEPEIGLRLQQHIVLGRQRLRPEAIRMPAISPRV